MRMLLALLILSLPAEAGETPLSPEDFEAYVTGQTLSYSSGGVEYGAETYFDNRRVRWTFLDGDCTEGHWYVQSSLICFVYDNIPNHQCWSFYLRGGRLQARFENTPGSTELYSTERRKDPLLCLGPDVGV